MDAKLRWPFPGSKSATSASKAAPRTSSTKTAKPSEVPALKAQMTDASKEEARAERKPRGLSLFSRRSSVGGGESSAAGGRGGAPRKLSLHEWWKGADPQAVAVRRRSSSTGADQFWEAAEGGRRTGEEKGKEGPRSVRRPAGSGVLGLTESIRRRCEGFASPKPVFHEGGALAKSGEGKQWRAANVSEAGNAEKQGAVSTSTGPVPEKHSLVLQKIHSFEQIMRQRHTKKSSRQEQPTKTPATGSSVPPSSGKVMLGTASERKGRSKSGSSKPHGQCRRVDEGKLESRQVPSVVQQPARTSASPGSQGTRRSDESLGAPATSERTADHGAPSVHPNQSPEPGPVLCSSTSEKPNRTYKFGKSPSGNVADGQGLAKRSSPASNDSVIVLPRTASHGPAAQSSPKVPRSRESPLGQEAVDRSTEREGGTASENKGSPGRSSEASSQGLPLNASPSLRPFSPQIGAGAGRLGDPSGENEAEVLEVLRQSLALELPAASSPFSSWTELDSPGDKAAISPSVQSDDEWSLSDESVVTIQSDVSQLDKSYSISLAELRECGVESREDVKRGERLDHSASLSSNMSFMSVVSLIPNDELERLLEEVKCLEEETLQRAEDIQVVVLHKEEGAGLGFSIAGGVDHENKMVTAHKVFPNGLTAQEGTIAQGDEILSINGNSLKGVTHSEALTFLHKARPLKQAIVVARKVSEAERAAARKGSVSTEVASGSRALGAVPESVEESLTVDLMKNSSGLGFSLDGGKGSSQGDKPLTIKKVFQGGPAEKTGLIQPGDQLMRVHGEDYRDLTCYEAWNLIKALPAGPVRVVIRKRREGATGT